MNRHALGIIVLSLAASAAAAQDRYPSKPISIANPGPAGGAIDAPARAIGGGLSDVLKEQIITLNLPGAGGTIATARVASAAPDGYTLLFHHIGVATAPAQYEKLPFDTLKDLAPIGLSTNVPMMIVARNDFPPKTVAELTSYLKAQGDKVAVATAGPGSVSDLCAALLMKQIGKRFTLVPYKGSPPALLDIAAGRVDMICDQTSTSVSQVRAGTVKTYGVASAKRLDIMRDTPTLTEQGFPFVFSIWQGFYAPAGTPTATIDTLSKAVRDAVQLPAVQTQLAHYGIVPAPAELTTPAAHRKFLEEEIKVWTELYKNAPKN